MLPLGIAFFDSTSVFGVFGPVCLLIALFFGMRALKQRAALEGADRAADVWRKNAEGAETRMRLLEQEKAEGREEIHQLRGELGKEKMKTDLTAVLDRNEKIALAVKTNQDSIVAMQDAIMRLLDPKLRRHELGLDLLEKHLEEARATNQAAMEDTYRRHEDRAIERHEALLGTLDAIAGKLNGRHP